MEALSLCETDSTHAHPDVFARNAIAVSDSMPLITIAILLIEAHSLESGALGRLPLLHDFHHPSGSG